MDYSWILYLFLLLFQIITSREDLYCSVNNNVTIEFTVDPPGSTIFWRRDGISLRDVKVNTAGDDCATPALTPPAGYEFDCKTVQNMSVYNLKFKSNSGDNGIYFTLSNIKPTPTFSYTPYPLNTASPSHTNCGNFVDELKCKVECNCMKPSLSWKYVTEDQTEGNITIPNTDPVSCGSGGDNFYKLDINIKSSDIEKLLPATVTGNVNITGILSIGDEKINLSTTINVKNACPECRWCLPVLISCAVVIITGIIIAILRYVQWDELKDWKLYCFYFWCVLLVICLIILIIYVTVIELDCCDKETCNGFAIAEIVIDVLVILFYIFMLKKQCTKKEENPSSDISLKPKP